MEQGLKVNVVGTSSVGKTTFCKKLSKILSIPYIEMDALFWGPNWYMPSNEEFLPKLRLALKGSSWILDGNYHSRTTPLKWKSITTVIWLDFSFPRVLYQAVIRGTKRIISREELWPETGNRETLKALFSKDSIVLFAIKSFRKIRKRYKAVMESDFYSNIQFIRLKSPKEVNLFLSKVKSHRELIFDGTIKWR
ncbi:MAG: adenylate kinase [Candidatus Hermodarchaeota archaeon]